MLTYMKDYMHTNAEQIREQTLMMQEEAHYHHTLNDVVELMIQYGQLKVLMDITRMMSEVSE